MDAESKKLLQDTFNLAQENNNMLHKIRRAQKIARLMTIIYWSFIILSAVGAYYIIQPYVDQLKETYTGATESIKSFQIQGS